MPSKKQGGVGRRVIRMVVWGFVALFALIVIGLPALWLVGGEWIADQAGRMVTNGPLRGSGAALSLGKVHGTPWGTLVFSDVTFTVEDSTGSAVPLLEARELEVSFNPLELLRGNFTIPTVNADALDVRLVSRGDDFLLPAFSDDGDSASVPEKPPSSPFRLVFETIHIERGSLTLGLPDFPLSFSDLDAELTLRIDDQGIQFQPARFAADLNDSLGRLNLEHGSLVVDGPQGTVLDSLGGTWGESRIALSLREDATGTPRLRVQGERIPGAKLEALLNQPLASAFIQRGDLTVDLQENVSFGGTVTGTWERYAVNEAAFTAQVTDDAFTLQATGGGIWGGSVTRAEVWVPNRGSELDVDVTFRNFDLGRILADLELEPVPGILSGRARIHLDDRENPLEGQRVSVLLDAGHLLEIPFESLEMLALGGLESGYNIADAHFNLAEAEADFTGRVSPELIDAEVEFWGNLRPLSRFIPLEGLDGEGDLSAAVFGPPDSLVVSAQGFVEEFSALGVDIPRIDFHTIRGPIVQGRQVELSFDIDRAFEVAGFVVESARGDVLVRETGAQLTEFRMDLGDSTLEVSGYVSWDPVLRAALETGTATIGNRSFSLLKPVVVVYEDGVIQADSLTLETSQGRFVATGSYDTEERWVEVAFDLDDLDPESVLPPNSFPELSMSRIDGSLSLSGAIPQLDGTASVSIDRFQFDEFLLDSLRTTLSLTGPVIQVDHFSAFRGRGRVTAAGDVRMAGPLYTVLEREVFGPDIPGEETHWNLDFQTQDIRLAEWFSFLPPTLRPRGLVTSRLHIGGNSLNPEVRLVALADAVNARGFIADHLNAEIAYEKGLVAVDTLEVWYKGEPFQLSGSFPLDLSFKPFTMAVPERPMDLVMQTRGGSLRNLMVTPWIESVEGTFTGQIVAQGTPQDPILEGEINARADSVVVQNRSEVIRDANVWITMRGKEIRVVAADAMMGGGRVTARGTYSPFAKEEDSYRLYLSFDKAVVRETGVYAARVSGDLEVEPRIVDGAVYPFVTGDVRVHRAEYRGALEPQDVSSTRSRAFLYDVTLDAPSKIIVQSNDVSAELSATLRAVQTPERLELQGQMDILEGEWYTPTAKFRITEGTMTWTSTTTILPELNIYMETLSGGYVIEVHVTGPADAIDMVFTAYDPDTRENAGLSTEEIYRQLFLVGSGHLTTGSVIATGSRVFLPGFTQTLAGQTVLFDDLAIDPTTDETGETSYRVSVRKFITPELSLRFGQDVSRYFDPNFALEYRLGRSLFLRGESVRERTLDSSTVITRYQLDISARHDY